MSVKEHKSKQSGPQPRAAETGDDKPPIIPLRADGDDARVIDDTSGDGGDDKPPVIELDGETDGDIDSAAILG